MPAITVHDFRLSFLWVETFLDLLGDPVPANAPLAFLGRDYTYEPRFEKAQRGEADPGDPTPLAPPWIQLKGQHFWEAYLEVSSSATIPGHRAWRKLVPLRGKPDMSVEAPDWLPGRLSLEAYFYPHGAALVANAICRKKPVSLDEAIEIALRARHWKEWSLRLGDQVQPNLSLDQIADAGLDHLRGLALGGGAIPGKRAAPEPFTLFTIVRADGVDPGQKLSASTHRLLEAMTSWSESYQYDVLSELSEARLPMKKKSPLSHVLYGTKRGRAIWFPALFTLTSDKIHQLTCYHRNLLFASLQTESLCGFLSETARLSGPELDALPAARLECARHAGGILGRLYGDVRETYRSRSLRAQIEQNGFVDAVNTMRSRFPNMGGPLS